MNNDRRKALQEIIDTLQDAKMNLESLKDEEQDYYDNMPESLQGGEKGDRAEQAVSELEDAVNSIDEAMSSIQTTIE